MIFIRQWCEFDTQARVHHAMRSVKDWGRESDRRRYTFRSDLMFYAAFSFAGTVARNERNSQRNHQHDDGSCQLETINKCGFLWVDTQRIFWVVCNRKGSSESPHKQMLENMRLDTSDEGNYSRNLTGRGMKIQKLQQYGRSRVCALKPFSNQNIR